ncbi:variant erythrocyte surface antigen-1 family protein [Babesia caballi]|uniref:Variant erythrocyte surface antigen-1 family protein n=1 Tax=Babesia caballi TaxID=5871 RepID=A0AAV4M1I6_BABCB|nr:variant erythrocyte surface antigen-1 family protein [Babesia caballi]
MGRAVVAVTNLLNQVKDFGPGIKIEDFEQVKKALNNGSGDGLITKLAEGLQKFIGYENGNSNGTPKITGGGILPANVAKYQVCNAVLNFVIRFLEGLCEIKASGHDKVSEVIATLRKCVGIGKVPKGFDQLLRKIGEKVKEGFDKKINSGGSDGKLNGIFEKLESIVTSATNITEHQSHSVTQYHTAVEEYISKLSFEQDNNGNFRNLSRYLQDLFGKNPIKPTSSTLSDNEALNVSNLTSDITNVGTQANSVSREIGKLAAKPANAAVFTAVRDAATAFIAELQTKAYMSFYNGVNNKDVNNVQCAKIFLGCLPLYYQALTYIYWGCHDNGGRWRNLTLGGGALRSYFDSQGLLPLYVERSKTGAHIADSALKGFSEFQAAASSPSPFTYSTFTKELQDKVTTNGNQLYSNCPLSALYHGASCYFRCQQITNAKSAAGAPQTIREMLYFLAALQFSPQYDAFDGYVTEYFKAVTGNQSGNDSDLKLQVADSGITPKPGSSASSDTLSAADLKSHLASTFHLAPAFIGLIQDHSASDKSDPWLHSLFSNSQFNLSIPSSGAGIFGALSNYAYALQFQLSFLYIQCRNTYTVGCGWNQCTFGKDINKSLTDKDNCGKSGNLSPLQAFLTDKLKGFSRGHPGISDHLASCSSNSMCHVPMGFKAEYLRTAPGGNTQGENICLTLRPLCGGFNTPLRQLSEKLGCLTKRTPRTLGDLFGFMWHLNSQLFKNNGSATVDLSLEQFFNSFGLTDSGSGDILHTNPSVVLEKIYAKISNSRSSVPSQPGRVQSILKIASGLPFWYNIFMIKPVDSLPVRLFKLKSTDHKDTSNYKGDHNDLYSLYNPNCPTTSAKNCGPYLYPLTHSDGATYAPTHASTYLSWVLYLSDDLQSWFQDMLDEFKNIDCKALGCC